MAGHTKQLALSFEQPQEFTNKALEMTNSGGIFTKQCKKAAASTQQYLRRKVVTQWDSQPPQPPGSSTKQHTFIHSPISTGSNYLSIYPLYTAVNLHQSYL